jgi:hypothetical protein
MSYHEQNESLPAVELGELSWYGSSSKRKAMLGTNALVRTISFVKSHQFNSEAKQLQKEETAGAEIIYAAERANCHS